MPEFGVRSEVNVLVRAGMAEVTGRIQTELVRMVVELDRWPTYSDFEDKNLLPLYAAIAREGGLVSWARRLGYETSADLTDG